MPERFRFSVKLPKEVTRTRRLAKAGEPLAIFLTQARLLGGKLGCLLAQLPPSRPSDAAVAQTEGDAAMEPRRASWFEPEADALQALAARMQLQASAGHEVRCIFDNTAAGAAAGNALDLLRCLQAKEPPT